ncbi:hypothetical protein SSX86_004869 [Deinandra increscens subsp. villosa]|uniref:WRKY domain-containing protein n=1 Tax=Deinandra increscens subsp. villosa TaxID=3103831 RepID=A0AAP0DNS3_9ASTR
MTLKMESNSYHHHMDLLSDPFSSAADDVDQTTSLGFMELLGFQDYCYYSNNNNNNNNSNNNNYYPSSISEEIINTTSSYHHQLQPPPPLSVETEIQTAAHHLNGGGNSNLTEELTAVDEEESSVVLNGQPSSPSITSSTAHQQLRNPLKQCVKEKKAVGGDETKAKKKRKEKAPRFAFMTRTEIDHLDDGYRWRKYGQKAVKNSRFPRVVGMLLRRSREPLTFTKISLLSHESYYRCTSTSCNVKKRVERCMGDPSYIITTYEGQHNHLVTPANYSAPLIPSFNHLITTAAFTAATTTTAAAATPPAMLKLDQGGLLQDMLHTFHH